MNEVKREKKIVCIFSLGQFISSDLKILKMNFYAEIKAANQEKLSEETLTTDLFSVQSEMTAEELMAACKDKFKLKTPKLLDLFNEHLKEEPPLTPQTKVHANYCPHFLTKLKEVIHGEMIWDWFADTQLPELRIDKRPLEQTAYEFNQQFYTELSFERFQTLFNAMSTINEASFKNMQSIMDVYKNILNLNILLITHSNTSHLTYIAHQLLAEKNYSLKILQGPMETLPEEKIWVATSMASQVTNHPGTLRFGLNCGSVAKNIQMSKKQILDKIQP